MRIRELLVSLLILGYFSSCGQSTIKVVKPPVCGPPPPNERNANGVISAIIDSSLVENPDEPAEFPGGLDKFIKYVSANVKYPSPEKCMSGTIYASFIVEKDGSASNGKILKGLSGAPEFDNEVLQMIEKMPKWKPALKNGKPVRARFAFPIKFKAK